MRGDNSHVIFLCTGPLHILCPRFWEARDLGRPVDFVFSYHGYGDHQLAHLDRESCSCSGQKDSPQTLDFSCFSCTKLMLAGTQQLSMYMVRVRDFFRQETSIFHSAAGGQRLSADQLALSHVSMFLTKEVVFL